MTANDMNLETIEQSIAIHA